MEQIERIKTRLREICGKRDIKVEFNDSRSPIITANLDTYHITIQMAAEIAALAGEEIRPCIIGIQDIRTPKLEVLI